MIANCVSLENLPPELFTEIFIKLEPKDLFSIQETCKKFHHCIENSRELQITLIYEKFRQTYSCPFRLSLYKKGHSLCIRTSSELSLWHFLNDKPPLLPYVEYLFIHEATQQDLTSLCKLLKEKKPYPSEKYLSP
jgi:hypothetical protein